MALWLALGWAALGSWLKRYPILLPILIGVTVVPQWWLFAATNSFAGTTRVGDLAKEQAQTLQKMSSPARPVQFWASHDDVLWAFWYAQHTLGLAPDVVTPWGRALNLNPQPGASARYVARLKPRFPVVLAQWDDATDARFPLQMLDEAGTMCLASDRALPLPAQPICRTVPSASALRARPALARRRRQDARDSGRVPGGVRDRFPSAASSWRPRRNSGDARSVDGTFVALCQSASLANSGRGSSRRRRQPRLGRDDATAAPGGARRRRAGASGFARAFRSGLSQPLRARDESASGRALSRAAGEAKPWRLSDRFDITAR